MVSDVIQTQKLGNCLRDGEKIEARVGMFYQENSSNYLDNSKKKYQVLQTADNKIYYNHSF